MTSSISWQDLLFLQSIKHRAAYLKMMSEVWGIKIQSIVEIGVFEGENSQLFRFFFPDAILYLIDPWEVYEDYLPKEAGPMSTDPSDYEKIYQSVKTSFIQDPKVKILRKSSMESLADVPDGLDLVFIDGNHSYPFVKQDIENWFPKVRPGGILSGHDYSTSFPGVIQAVDEYFPEGIVLGHDSTWVKQKL